MRSRLTAKTFRGTFNSRQEALKAALEAAAHEADSPATVYVACRAPLDPHAQGHAETLIQRMRRAVRADVGPEGEAFLKLVSDQELADLDHEIYRTIRAWLSKHELLLPSGKLAAISGARRADNDLLGDRLGKRRAGSPRDRRELSASTFEKRLGDRR
jgi:hypothetical protein